MKKNINFGFIGRGEQALKILSKLINDGYKPKFIITRKKKKIHKTNNLDYKLLANKNKIPFKFVHSLRQEKIFKFLKKNKTYVNFCFFWGHILDKEVLETSKFGFINLHGGLLPSYKGNACANWAILNKEKYFGITLHLMHPNEIDTGDIINQKKLQIKKEYNVTDLYNFVTYYGYIMSKKFLWNLKNRNKISLKKQKTKNSSRCYPRIEKYSLIDWKKKTDEIIRLIRSLGYPYHNAFCYFNFKKLEILEANEEKKNTKVYTEPGHVVEIDNKNETVLVATQDSFIRIKKINYLQRKNIPPTIIIKSIRTSLDLGIYDLIQYIRNTK